MLPFLLAHDPPPVHLLTSATADTLQNIREHLHVHRCDRRVPKSELTELFPSFTFPEDMSEEDTLWRAEGRETDEELNLRAGMGLEECLAQSQGLTCESA
jgi:hypothetical protein